MEPDKRSEQPLATEPDEKIPRSVIPLHSTNLLTVLDENGVVQYESPAIERIFGYDQDALVGEQVAEYVHPDDRDRVVEAFRAVVSSEECTIESVEYQHEQADGSYAWVESVASANPTPGGYYVVNTRDISDQKAREAELERTNERLDEFASVVSHDLRNPLNVAAGRLQLVREEYDSGHLDDIARAHERIEALIDDLLTLARDGKRTDTLESIDLAVLVETCWRTVATEDATLVTDVDRSVHADRSRLTQLLENLVRNAVEHGDGNVTVTVGELGERAGFYVADDGPGVAENCRERVFESGFSTGERGTGLGLTIVTEIAEAHGWTVNLTESREGGARFEITGVELL